MGLTYCGLHETDGHIPYEALATFGPLPAVNRSAARLVAVGFWHQTNGGYRMHNWPLYQPLRQNGKLVRHQGKYLAARMRDWSDARARASSDARIEESRGESDARARARQDENEPEVPPTPLGDRARQLAEKMESAYSTQIDAETPGRPVDGA
jgi:hypothetical protein